MGDRKIFAGARVRRLRRTLGLSQAAMARDLDISASYLNLVERDQRPLTASLLLRLADTFDLDPRELSGDGEARLSAELAEALSDPLFAGDGPGRAEALAFAADSPVFARRFLVLYRAYLRAARGEADPAQTLAARDRRPPPEDDRFPIEEVRDYFHARSNHVAELDTAAEEARATLGARDDLFPALRAHLSERHGIRVTVLPVHAMEDCQRRYDAHNRRLFLSELLPAASRTFQTAVQVALADEAPLLDRLAADAPFATEEARRICRIGLANYYAGALMMPYEAFHDAAEKVRYDMTLLAARFGASIEQVAHRLTTLQRRDRKGVPFFLLRLDNAGNISKRYSAGGFPFARFGGTCPRWRVHDAFAAPGQTIVQPVELPDGAAYLTICRTVDGLPTPHPETPRKLAIGLGCEMVHARKVVYGDGLDLGNPAALTPIGVTCRTCERSNCPARAFPPMTRPLVLDASRKNLSAFEFG
jgi:predicted transcriptional regulator/transcriptional regulator with XRE-family HTH domain